MVVGLALALSQQACVGGRCSACRNLISMRAEMMSSKAFRTSPGCGFQGLGKQVPYGCSKGFCDAYAGFYVAVVGVGVLKLSEHIHKDGGFSFWMAPLREASRCSRSSHREQYGEKMASLYSFAGFRDFGGRPFG